MTPTKIFRFDSPADFANAADQMPESKKRCDSGWTGESWDGAVRGARTGHTKYVAQAEALLEKVMINVDAPRTVWAPSRAGAFPCVPDAIAGLPECMRRRVSTSDDRAPLRVYIDLVSSAGIPEEKLVKRGVACLALAMALSAERPVEVFGVVAMGEKQPAIVTYRIGAAPIDLATACNALCSIGLVRGVGYSFISNTQEKGHDGGWAWGIMPESGAARAQYVAKMREELGASTQDVIIPGVFLYDDEATRDPEGFVRRSLADHNKIEEA